MKGKSKCKFMVDFKFKVVLEVFKEKDILVVISKWYELYFNQISDWKKQFMDIVLMFFEFNYKVVFVLMEFDVILFYEQIGWLQMELMFFKKKLF